ncbi:MAG: hypothetical protein WBC85_06190 [Planktotalea sp.]|uniref:hypothetical protein n=1 Tax=Planktotalea sp. TaxID=2029877 RepID=UPI003C716121
MTQRYSVNYFGTFSLVAPDGRNVTPKGSKAKGLLAMLCEITEMRRGRRWLEGRLWSNRSAAQASGSLRQTLSEIKACFGEDDHVFGADRLDVWLNPEFIETDLDAIDNASTAERDLLEGLVIRDEQFQDWLNGFRARYGSVQSTPQSPAALPNLSKIKIRAIQSDRGTTIEQIAGNVIADQVAKSIEERLSARRFSSEHTKSPDTTPDLEIRCNVAKDGESGIVFLQVHRGHDGRILFSGHRSVAGDLSEAISANIVQGLVHSAVSKINHRMPSVFDLNRPEVAATGFTSLGLRKLSRFDPQGLDDAQSHFASAHDADPNGVYLAWRAFARMAQLVEGAGSERDAHLEEVKQLTSDTLQTSGDNGLAVALVALTRIMLDDDLIAPAELAQKAILWNENNFFAQQTLAVAHSAVGDTEKAYQISRACQNAFPQDELGHLWDLYHSLVCISSGRLDEARQAALRASQAAPAFVAPRRQLVALCANAGDLENARVHLNALRKLESDFSLDRYLNDPEYPVLTLRNAGLIQPINRDKLET